MKEGRDWQVKGVRNKGGTRGGYNGAIRGRIWASTQLGRLHTHANLFCKGAQAK